MPVLHAYVFTLVAGLSVHTPPLLFTPLNTVIGVSLALVAFRIDNIDFFSISVFFKSPRTTRAK